MRKNNYSTEEAEIIMQEQPVQKGRVRSYDAKRGYGWIYQKNQENGKEVYFRRDDLIDDSSSLSSFTFLYTTDFNVTPLSGKA